MGLLLSKVISSAREYARYRIIEGITRILDKALCVNLGCNCSYCCACFEVEQINAILDEVRSHPLYEPVTSLPLPSFENDDGQGLTDIFVRVFESATEDSTLNSARLLTFYTFMIDETERFIRCGKLAKTAAYNVFRNLNVFISNMFGFDELKQVYRTCTRGAFSSSSFFSPFSPS